MHYICFHFWSVSNWCFEILFYSDNRGFTYWSHFDDQVSENIQIKNCSSLEYSESVHLLGVSKPFYRHSFNNFHQREYNLNIQSIIFNNNWFTVYLLLSGTNIFNRFYFI